MKKEKSGWVKEAEAAAIPGAKKCSMCGYYACRCQNKKEGGKRAN